MRLTQGLRRSSFLTPNTIATICGDRVTAWGALEDRVARLANGLLSLGVKTGDHVAILAMNSDRYIEAYHAIAWAGCVAVPFNTRWAPAEVNHALDDSRPAAVLVDSTFAAEGERFAASGLLVVWMDGVGSDFGFESLIASNGPADDRCGSGDELAIIFYTGGTTGRAKGVMLSHANLVSNFLGQQAVAPFNPGTVFLHTPPLFHMADACFMFGLTMLGATHVVLPGFTPASTIEAIERHGVNALFLVPTMIGMLCEEVAARPVDLSGVRRLTYGASSISEAVLKRAMKVLPNAAFVQAYGQTELSPIATLLLHEDHLAGRLRSAGRPIPQVDIRIVDEALHDVGPGKVGEVMVRGPGVMQGYWQRPDLTGETIVDGWLRTGDAGRLDEQGYLYLVDRVKDMIVSGGENVYSAEVENALLQHPDVLQCAVIGVPDAKWGEAVHAVICLRSGSHATEADLIAHCAPLIANYKRPKSFDLRNESLPLSGVGKIMKAELRRPFWGRDRFWDLITQGAPGTIGKHQIKRLTTYLPLGSIS